MKKKRIITNQYDDLNCSLLHCVQALELATENPTEWKWVITSLHSALQGAMVCHLAGSAGLGALTEKCAEAHLEWHERRRKGKMPKHRIADFETLLKRIKRKDKMIVPANPIDCTQEENEAAILLNRIRRRMAHFVPGIWQIELAGLPTMVARCTNVIRKIIDDRWAFLGLNEAQRVLIYTQLAELQNVARKLESQVEGVAGTH